MGPVRSIYEKSPVWAQHIMMTLAGCAVNAQRYGSGYKKHRRWLTDFDRLTLTQKRNYQREATEEFLAFARARSRYYSRVLPESPPATEVTASSVESRLATIPILEKDTLRSRIDDVTTVGPRGAVEGHTGGTTGKSLVVRFTRDDNARRMAMLDHFKSRVGFENRSMTRASFTGRHIVPAKQEGAPFWRYNGASRQMLYSSVHISDHTAADYLASLNRFGPDALDGFPSAMVALARFAKRNGVPINFTPRAIFPTSEMNERHW